MDIISNAFTTSINRSTQKAIVSDEFRVTIDKESIENNNPSAQINIYKGKSLLKAVSKTPEEGQYKIVISKTTNCRAFLSTDNKSILITSMISNKGDIDVLINIENKNIYTKTIHVSTIDDLNILENLKSEIEKIDNKIELLIESNLATSSSNQLLSIIVKQFNIMGEVLSKDIINNEKTVGIEVRNSCNIFIIDEEGNIKGVGLIDSQGENFQIITQSLIELKK